MSGMSLKKKITNPPHKHPMRTREEIEKDGRNYAADGAEFTRLAILETLLDIRELLTPKE